MNYLLADRKESVLSQYRAYLEEIWKKELRCTRSFTRYALQRDNINLRES